MYVPDADDEFKLNVVVDKTVMVQGFPQSWLTPVMPPTSVIRTFAPVLNPCAVEVVTTAGLAAVTFEMSSVEYCGGGTSPMVP